LFRAFIKFFFISSLVFSAPIALTRSCTSGLVDDLSPFLTFSTLKVDLLDNGLGDGSLGISDVSKDFLTRFDGVSSVTGS